MACMGPDLGLARKQGHLAYLRFRKIMEKQYGVAPKGAFGLNHRKKEINEQWNKMQNAIEELFIEQACDDF